MSSEQVASTAPTGPHPARATTDATGATTAKARGATIVLSRAALAAVGVYVGAQVISQVTSTKLGIVLGRSVDMGTFVYPITFTLRDVVHKTAGRSAARTMILTSALVNLFLAAYLTWTARVASDPDWGLGEAYADVLGPIWRIVIASLVAMVIAELIDTEVYHWWVTRITTRFQWARVLVSNAISVPIDNIVFAVGAFAVLPLVPDAVNDTAVPWSVVWDIFMVNLVFKLVVSVASMPLIYLVPDRNESPDR